MAGLFGPPSLGPPPAAADDDEGEDSADHPHSEPLTVPDVETLAGLETIWPAFLDQVGGKGPRFLLLQMKRCVLKEFENDTLLLAVDNEFGLRMVQEHMRLFTDILTAMLGRRIRIMARVERGTSPAAAASRDPYEEFRDVLRKDPVARELVELFGAELRYDV